MGFMADSFLLRWILLLVVGIPCLLVFVGVMVVAVASVRKSRSKLSVFPCSGCDREVPQFADCCPHSSGPLLEPSE